MVDGEKLGTFLLTITTAPLSGALVFGPELGSTELVEGRPRVR